MGLLTTESMTLRLDRDMEGAGGWVGRAGWGEDGRWRQKGLLDLEDGGERKRA